MEAIVRACATEGWNARVAAVVSNRAAAPGLEFARQHGIATSVVEHANYETREAFDAELALAIEAFAPDVVALAGFMRILTDDFVARFEGRFVNVHPSLLPAFPGLGAIEQALAYGVKVFGVTVHFVDAGVDSGPVILQRAVELPRAREPEEVLAALRPLEHSLLPQAVRLIARGAVRADGENPRRTVVDSPASEAAEG